MPALVKWVSSVLGVQPLGICHLQSRETKKSAACERPSVTKGDVLHDADVAVRGGRGPKEGEFWNYLLQVKRLK